MPVTLTIEVSHPDVVRGDARTHIYNSVAQSMEVLGPEWSHVETKMSNGSLVINFRRTLMGGDEEEDDEEKDIAAAMTTGQLVAA